MVGNEEEAARTKTLVDKLMRDGDFVGAKRLLMGAQSQRLFSGLHSLPQMLAVCDVHTSAVKKINGLKDWYNILQVMPSSDDVTIRKQYKKLALLLHPDKNHFPGAETAFRLIQEANTLLTDKEQRLVYDGALKKANSVFNKKKRKKANSTAPRFTCCKCGVLRPYADTSEICQSCVIRNAERKILYIYPEGKIWGPFPVSKIIRWFEEGFFEADLQVRFADAPEGTPFQDLGNILPDLKPKESVHGDMSTSDSVLPNKDLSLKR